MAAREIRELSPYAQLDGTRSFCVSFCRYSCRIKEGSSIPGLTLLDRSSYSALRFSPVKLFSS
jgi:hypothetical protein